MKKNEENTGTVSGSNAARNDPEKRTINRIKREAKNVALIGLLLSAAGFILNVIYAFSFNQRNAIIISVIVAMLGVMASNIIGMLMYSWGEHMDNTLEIKKALLDMRERLSDDTDDNAGSQE